MSLSDFLQDVEEIKRRKNEEDEEATNDIGGSQEVESELYREPEPVSNTGAEETTDGAVEPQPDAGTEVLAEGEGNTVRRVRTREEWSQTIQSDGDGGILYVPQDEEDVEEAYKIADLNWRHLRTEGFGTSHAYSFFRWLGHKAGSLFVDETEPFDKEEAFKRDGVQEKDKCLYSWADTAYDYNYIKNGIEQERTDNEILRNAPFASTLLANTAEFAASLPIFKGLDTVLNGLVKASNLAEGVTRLANWKKFFSWIKPAYAEDLAKAVGSGAVYGVSQYLAKYDVSGEEAFYQALSWAFIDAGFRTTGRYVTEGFKKKVLKELTEDLSAKDPDAIVMERMKEFYDEFISLDEEAVTEEAVTASEPKVNKLTKTAMTKGITATHPYMLAFTKNSKTAQLLAYALFKFNPKLFPGADWTSKTGMFQVPSMESACRFYKAETSAEYTELVGNLNKYNPAVKKACGMSARELFNRIYIKNGNSGGIVPVDTPYLKEITSEVRKLIKKMEELHDYEIKIMGHAPGIESTFLPEELGGKNFDLGKIVESVNKKFLGVRPGYFPIFYSREALEGNEEEAKEIIGQALVYRKAINLGKKATKENLQAFMESPEFKKSVDIQFNDATGRAKIPNDEKGGRLIYRVIRAEPTLLLKFLKKDAIEATYNYRITKYGQLAFEDAIQRCGFKNFDELLKGVAGEYQEKLNSLTGEEAVALQREARKTNILLKQARYIALYRYTPLDEIYGLFRENPQIIKAIEDARSLMMAAYLGRAVLSSICDVKGMVANYGGKDTFDEIMRTMGGAFDRAYRHLLKLPESKREQVLKLLITGIEENNVFASGKFVPITRDEMFFSPGSIAEKNWCKEIGEWSFIATGQRAFDNGLRKTASNLILKRMADDPVKGKAIEEALANKKFPRRLQQEILEKIDSLVTKPGLADVPKWAYTTWGRFFYMLQSWVFANTANYVYPLLNGAFSRRYAAESLIGMVSLKMIEMYAKGIVSGKPYDLSNKDDQNRFYNAMINQGLSDLVGASEIYYSGIKSLFTRAGTLRSPIYALADLSPITGYLGDGALLLSNIMRPIFGLDRPTYAMARKGLHSVPGNTIPGISTLFDKLAEEWSGESKDSKGGRNSGGTGKRNSGRSGGKRR